MRKDMMEMSYEELRSKGEMGRWRDTARRIKDMTGVELCLN